MPHCEQGVLTEIIRKRVTAQKAYKAVQLAHSVLKRRPREAPTVPRLQLESCFGGVRCTLLDVVRLVELIKRRDVRG